jgi:hypothetical protein
MNRSALQNEKETYAIYRAQLGDDHDKTREASECLKHLTQQVTCRMLSPSFAFNYNWFPQNRYF